MVALFTYMMLSILKHKKFHFLIVYLQQDKNIENVLIAVLCTSMG